MTTHLEGAVAAHYGRPGLLDTILDGLRAAGADPDHPTPDDLAPVDEFHTAGRVTTLRALSMLPLTAGMHVLDAGCGIGGTARPLASHYRCRATGLDLTPDYVETARALTGRMGLTAACDFHHGSVTQMPFRDGAFDAAVTFHVAMNVADRDAFYGELARVLAPGAPLCLFDVMKGPADGMRYPVPWAETPETSVLHTPAETRMLLDAAGFSVTAEDNLRAFAIDFFRAAFARAQAAGGPPPLGLHQLTGANAPEKFANYLAALEDHQIEPVIMVAQQG